MNIIEGIQKEQERIRELKKEYEAIGPAGAFGLMFINAALKDADKVIASGDVVEMLKVFSELKEITG